jgi:hypothetical protein
LAEAVEKPIVRRQLASIFVLGHQEEVHLGVELSIERFG